jgi:heavy metal translocating P-type ATPase
MKAAGSRAIAYDSRGSILLLVIAAAGTLLFVLLQQAGYSTAQTFGMALLVTTSVPLVTRTIKSALNGNFSTDAVATLSLVGSALLRQPLPGLIIVLMQSGGEWIEGLAQRRASRALALLESRAPRVAHRMIDGIIIETGASSVAPGDTLLVRAGEVVPVDGVVTSGTSYVDTSTLTGEPLPRAIGPGSNVSSGFMNATAAFMMSATRTAEQSQYALIVDLVRAAQADKAPLQRVADRYAVWFTPLVLVICALVYWRTGDALRVLAVLVVATPCPLILAAPVAFVAGINVGARNNILFRSGAALEQLAHARSFVFDKTGTLTGGAPQVASVRTFADFEGDQVIRLAGAVAAASNHIVSREIARYAAGMGLNGIVAADVQEEPGAGVGGNAEGHSVRLGTLAYATAGEPPSIARPAMSDAFSAFVSIDGSLAAQIEMRDELRAGATAAIAALRQDGIRNLSIISGDTEASVRNVARSLGITESKGNVSPPGKLSHLKAAIAAYGPTAMVGDGINDAPALAAASVGIAIAPRSGDIAAETADVVLLDDNLMRLHEAIILSRRTLKIAKQSIIAGLGLSFAGIVVASFGGLTPVAGAVFQEAVDLAVIANALRAARG